MKPNILILLLIPSCFAVEIENLKQKTENTLDERSNYQAESRSPTSRRKTIKTTTHYAVKTRGPVSYLPSASPVAARQGLTGIETRQPSTRCIEAGYISDPEDCHKFYSCVVKAQGDFTAIPLSCATGTVFDSVKSKCSSRGICGTISESVTDTEPVRVSPPSQLPEKPAREPELEHPLETETVFTEEESSEIPDFHHEFESELDSMSNFQPIADTADAQKNTEGSHPVVIREVESMEEYEPIVLEQLQTKPKSVGSTKPRIVSTTHASPNAWFGLVRTNTNESPGNPFKDQETSLAIILDFSTSRLQIFSKNVPKKAIQK